MAFQDPYSYREMAIDAGIANDCGVSRSEAALLVQQYFEEDDPECQAQPPEPVDWDAPF
jgi:hypothetical protein